VERGEGGGERGEPEKEGRDGTEEGILWCVDLVRDAARVCLVQPAAIDDVELSPAQLDGSMICYISRSSSWI